MPVKKDLSGLPKAAPQQDPEADGWPPDRDPTVGHLIAQAWHAEYQATEREQWGDDDRPCAIPEAGPLRASMGASCARQIAYGVAGEPKSDPPTVADSWRFWLGKVIHDNLQDKIDATWPGSQREVAVDLRPMGVEGSCNMDHGLWVEGSEVFIPAEIKSINGMGFKSAATSFRYTKAAGPRTSAVYQLCLATAGIAAGGCEAIRPDQLGPYVKWVYLSLELVSPKIAASIGLGGQVDRFVAEWTMPTEEAIERGQREGRRLQGILDKTREQGPDAIKRAIPYEPKLRGAEVVDALTGRWEKVDPDSGLVLATDTTWQCGYCSYQSRCAG